MAVSKNNRKFGKRKKILLRNHSGASVVEMLPLLVVFIILFGLTLGLWQTIHSGVLRSIATRHYAFEVINNRTHIVYHRDTKKPQDDKQYYRKNGYRFFGSIKRQPISNPQPLAREKEINRFNLGGTQISSINVRNVADPDLGQVNPIKLKIGYGMCLDCQCGGTTCP